MSEKCLACPSTEGRRRRGLCTACYLAAWRQIRKGVIRSWRALELKGLAKKSSARKASGRFARALATKE